MTAIDSEQLQLLRLCFGEHEFGASSDGSATDTGDFDPAVFVKEKLHQQVPLETLCADLESFSRHLQNKILHHIHRDVYEAFVTVSGQLVGMQDQLARVHNPLLAAGSKVEGAVSYLTEAARSVDETLERAQQIDISRQIHEAFLEVLILHENLASNVAFLESAVGNELSEEFFEVLSAAVADTFGMKCVLRSIPRTATVDARLKIIEDSHSLVHDDSQAVLSILSLVFATIVRNFSSQPSIHYSRQFRTVSVIFHALDDPAAFCSFFREQIVRPLAEEVISWKAASQARQSALETVQLLALLGKELQAKVLPLLPVLREIFGQGLNPISSIVWPTVCDVIVKRMIFIFVPGIPTTFHTNFVNAHKIVSLLEEHCVSVSELVDFRSSADNVMWSHKWNIDVYHTLRSTELKSKLSEVQENRAKTVFHSKELQAAASASLWMFSEDVFLFPLFARFAKDALQCIHDSVNSLLQRCQGGDISFTCTASADFATMEVFVRTELHHAMQSALGNMSTVTDVIAVGERFCRVASQLALNTIADFVHGECHVALQSVKTIKNLYALTKKPMPTSPSWFIANIIEPLSQFKEAAAKQRNLLTEDVAKRMTSDIILRLTVEYRAIAKEMLLQARKQEESFKKLKRKDAATSETANSVGSRIDTASDIDKMFVQVYLDIHEFGSRLRPFGISKESYAPIGSLLKLVRRANWILGDDIPEPVDLDDAE